ncbi:MAG: lycopene cyclase domain-containing protein [Chloroflexi bacterium]|nr:lycopene cyclase domain-containing protein [Chloroflexota bacterium]
MTYFEILVIFIGPPLALLAGWAWWDARRGRRMGAGLNGSRAATVVVAHVVIALLYTTPWDNYLVATRVWWYDPDLVTGLTLGWVPIEEYTFFVLQSLFSGLMLLTLARRVLVRPPAIRPSLALRQVTTAAAGVIWIASVALLLSGWQPGVYLGLILVWALPPVITQLYFGADILRAHARLVVLAILLPTIYLCVTDTVAIEAGTWTIDPAQSTGIMLAGVLPMEEALFFLITNVLLVFGMTLMLDGESVVRVQAWRQTVMQWLESKERLKAAGQDDGQ